MEETKTGLASDYQLAKHINSSRSQVWALVKKNPHISKTTAHHSWNDQMALG